MKKILLVCCVCFFAFASMVPDDNVFGSDDKKFSSLLPSAADEGTGVTRWIDSIYNVLRLDSFGLKENVFFYACKGYQYLLSKNKLRKTSLLTICDYSQSSGNKRLYVIELAQGKLLFNTYVSHGKNSGSEYATSFSNRSNSHKSSLGFMITGETYSGRAGYSMYLDGVEEGINDKVRLRDIVMHGSSYVNAGRADEGTTMGRSYSCPAVSFAEHKKIINEIKEGSCFFIYAEDEWYASTSGILNAHFSWSLAAASVNTPANNNSFAVQ